MAREETFGVEYYEYVILYTHTIKGIIMKKIDVGERLMTMMMMIKTDRQTDSGH